MRYLEAMGQLYLGAYEAYLDVSYDDFAQHNEDLNKIEKEMDDLVLQIQMTLMLESLMPDSRDELL